MIPDLAVFLDLLNESLLILSRYLCLGENYKRWIRCGRLKAAVVQTLWRILLMYFIMKSLELIGNSFVWQRNHIILPDEIKLCILYAWRKRCFSTKTIGTIFCYHHVVASLSYRSTELRGVELSRFWVVGSSECRCIQIRMYRYRPYEALNEFLHVAEDLFCRIFFF